MGEIETVQQKYPDIHIFKGIEADILPDGSMDSPDPLLAEFDFVIASVHSRFNLSKADQTRRMCRALANPYVTMLGHPTGRLLLSRPGYRVDLAQVIDAAVTHHKLLEINGSRYRLDLDWRWVRIAKAQGVKFCVNPDAHAVDEPRNISYGVNVARIGPPRNIRYRLQHLLLASSTSMAKPWSLCSWEDPTLFDGRPLR